MPELESLGSVPRALAAVILLLASSVSVGSLFRPISDASSQKRWNSRLLQVIVGLNLVGFLGMVLGILGLLPGMRSIWLLLGLALLPFLRFGRSRRQPGASHPGKRLFVSRRPWQIVLVTAVFAATLVTLSPALCPPSGWDELVYHEVLPQRWLSSGSPQFYPDLPYSGFPAMGEILFWLVAPLESSIAPRLLNWVCWMLALLSLYGVLRRYLERFSATVLTVVFPLSETGLLVAENCYVETIVMMNLGAMLLATASMRRERIEGSWRLPVVLGVLVGGAAAVKLTGAAVAVVPCVWYAYIYRRDRSHQVAIAQRSVICLATAMMVAFPFYLRPWLATGNPFYPYFSHWFATDPAVLEMSRHQHAMGEVGFGVKGFAPFVTGPLLLAFNSATYDGRFGWQLIGFVALAVVAVMAARRPRARLTVFWPASVALWFYLFWFFTAQQARFAIPAVLAIAVLGGAGLHQLRGAWRRGALAALTVAALASIPWERTGYYWYSILAATGRVSREDYVHNMTDRVYLPLVQAIDALTPPDAKLLLLYEHRGFYLPRQNVIGTPLFQEGPFTPPEHYADPDHVMDVLRREQITHVVIPSVAMGPDCTEDWLERQTPFLAAIDACVLQGKLLVVWKSEAYLLVAVQTGRSSDRVPLSDSER
ncbi:MAG: hypothetical protein GXX96_03825 [Planctomycetaceae bacterium]|nr:hypothetical protein [Planctomycetaceae bacterium]